jgi:hypothetical protein
MPPSPPRILLFLKAKFIPQTIAIKLNFCNKCLIILVQFNFQPALNLLDFPTWEQRFWGLTGSRGKKSI